MSDIHGTVYVSASGDDSTQATVNPVFKTMTKAVSVNPDKIVVLDGDYPAADPMVFNGIPIEIRDGNITTGLYCGSCMAKVHEATITAKKLEAERRVKDEQERIKRKYLQKKESGLNILKILRGEK